MPKRNNHTIKQLSSVLQDAAHFTLKTEKNWDASFISAMWGNG